jgi:hypothetical protein
MTVGDEDHGGIPVTMSVAFGGLDQLVDLERRLDARACGIRCSADARQELLAFCRLAQPSGSAISSAFVRTPIDYCSHNMPNMSSKEMRHAAHAVARPRTAETVGCELAYAMSTNKATYRSMFDADVVVG